MADLLELGECYFPRVINSLEDLTCHVVRHPAFLPVGEEDSVVQVPLAKVQRDPLPFQIAAGVSPCQGPSGANGSKSRLTGVLPFSGLPSGY